MLQGLGLNLDWLDAGCGVEDEKMEGITHGLISSSLSLLLVSCERGGQSAVQAWLAGRCGMSVGGWKALHVRASAVKEWL